MLKSDNDFVEPTDDGSFNGNVRSLMSALQDEFTLTCGINFLSYGPFRSDWYHELHHHLNLLMVAPAYPKMRYPKSRQKQTQEYWVRETNDKGHIHYHGQIILPPVHGLGREFNNYTLHPIKKRIEVVAQRWRPGADFYLERTREPERCLSYNLKELAASTDCIWEYINWQSAMMQSILAPHSNVFYPFELPTRIAK